MAPPPRGPDVTSSESHVQHHIIMCTHVHALAASQVYACACTCSSTCVRMCMYLQHHLCTHVHVLAASHVYACACTCSITCVRMCMYLQHHVCALDHILHKNVIIIHCICLARVATPFGIFQKGVAFEASLLVSRARLFFAVASLARET